MHVAPSIYGMFQWPQQLGHFSASVELCTSAAGLLMLRHEMEEGGGGGGGGERGGQIGCVQDNCLWSFHCQEVVLTQAILTQTQSKDGGLPHA